MKNIEEKQDAWKMLLEALESKENLIRDYQLREIELLKKLMEKEDNIKSLIHIIAEKTFNPKV